MPPEMAKSLQISAFPKELMDVAAAARAARARVAVHEDSRNGGLAVSRRARALRLVLAQADNAPRVLSWGPWATDCFILNLDAALDEARAVFGDNPSILDVSHPRHNRVGWQAAVARRF
eukprot:5046444-Pyramimonas_sp.AAC.1